MDRYAGRRLAEWLRHLAQCGRQAHSSDLSADSVLQATEKGPKMHAPFVVQQRMEFIVLAKPLTPIGIRCLWALDTLQQSVSH